MSFESLFTRSWYGRCGWTNVFRPLQPWVKKAVLKKRTAFLEQTNIAYKAPVPVIVVGNISVGGTGKSPMVIALCKLLSAHGYRPGIVSRGHGVTIATPTHVYPDSLASVVGDEPVMLARRAACPIVVFPKRAEAVKYLLATTDINIIVCDDGMQHYQLSRDIEIAMLDASRGVGNGQLLPVGPLREPVERLNDVDFIVSISETMTASLQTLNLPIILTPLTSSILVSLDQSKSIDCRDAFLNDTKWHVVAGIGNPQRFLNILMTLGLSEKRISNTWYADHHSFEVSDIPIDGAVLMTEKDAVKCQPLRLPNSNVWYLPVSLVLPDDFQHAFLDKLNLIKSRQSP